MKEDSEFMSNLSAAMVMRHRRESKIIVNVILVAVIWAIVWSYFATVDQITRGMGKIVTQADVQVVQNLEGGIISEILVASGDLVEKGQPLLKIDNKGSESVFEESRLKLGELRLRSARLYAEANHKGFKPEKELADGYPELVKNETLLFEAHMKFLENEIRIISHQIEQKRQAVADDRARIVHLKESLALLDKQIKLTRPLVEQGIESQTDFLKLERERVTATEKIESARFSIRKHKGAIRELEGKTGNLRMSFRNRAQKELTEVVAKISQIREKQNSLEDRVSRTLVTSPVKGIVKQLLVNTIGGVAKPGMNLVEIVPVEDTLLVEAKIKPSDIAFLHPDQKAVVKCTAYDFSIYGGLDGRVVRIGADTMTDKRGQSYYLVYIKTDKNHLGTREKPLKIIPGMMASVDILTGRKTVMDYLLKPILKAKQNALTER